VHEKPDSSFAGESTGRTEAARINPRRFVLASRPREGIESNTFRLEPIIPASLERGQARLAPIYLSLDPAMRSWLDDRPSYVPPVELGATMRGRGVGRVIESRSDQPHLRVGSIVVGPMGWQEEIVVDSDADLRLVDSTEDREVRGALGLFGHAGLTAWVGINLGEVRPGETVVVSAAAGAVGSIAAQIARIRGARVVGIAGGTEKCHLLRNELGLDAAVNYRTHGWLDRLAEATPNGIDVDFENVGGRVLEGVIDRMNNHGRIALCGLISTYDRAFGNTGPANFREMVTKRIRAEGFIVHDHLQEADAAVAELRSWFRSGELQMLETVIDGFEKLPHALAGLFRGENIGKMVVRLG
jgi:NADPH-dependent curcumin reductase CurA